MLHASRSTVRKPLEKDWKYEAALSARQPIIFGSLPVGPHRMQHAEFTRFVQPRGHSKHSNMLITQELSQEDCRASLSVSFARKLPIGGNLSLQLRKRREGAH